MLIFLNYYESFYSGNNQVLLFWSRFKSFNFCICSRKLEIGYFLSKTIHNKDMMFHQFFSKMHDKERLTLYSSEVLEKHSHACWRSNNSLWTSFIRSFHWVSLKKIIITLRNFHICKLYQTFVP